MRFILILPLLFLYNFYLAQDNNWRIKQDVGNFILVENAWSEEEEIATIIVSGSSNTVYTVTFETKPDERTALLFPDDFVLVEGDSLDEKSIHTLTAQLKVKKETMLTQTFTYDPAPNAILQLNPWREPLLTEKDNIWGEVVDTYTWEDKKGTNVFVRSFIEQNYTYQDTNTGSMIYLYAYHFIKNVENLDLVRKFTDSYKNCEGENHTHFVLESIELTDLNRDTIGEIATLYQLGCTTDTLVNTKLLFTTKGEKYMMYGTPNKQGTLEIKGTLNLEQRPYYDRFMTKKMEAFLEQKETGEEHESDH